MSDLTPVQAERNYRRGYHQGFDDAVEIIFKLLEDEMPYQEVYPLAAVYTNLLGVWRAEENTPPVPPPPFRLEQIQEVLALRRGLQEVQP